MHEDLNRSYVHNANPFHVNAVANLSFGGNFVGGLDATGMNPTIEEVKISDSPNKTNGDGPDEKEQVMKDEEEAMQAWKVHLQKNKSVIVDLF